MFFHDYCDYYPGVKYFVNELIHKDDYTVVTKVSSMIHLNKVVVDKRVTTILAEPVRAKEKVGACQSDDANLVSCIMPTANRRKFISRSIALFMAQSYKNKELIIIDDGNEPIADLIPERKEIRYVKLDTTKTIGYKRNLACQNSNGKFIVHWDDDDWYGPDWISKQIKYMLKEDLDITGLSNPLFTSLNQNESWQYRYPPEEAPWVHGATLCYKKSLWKQNKFIDSNRGEDNEFVWSGRQAKLKASPHESHYIGSIHNMNTSPKYTSHARWQKISAMITSRMMELCTLPSESEIQQN